MEPTFAKAARDVNLFFGNRVDPGVIGARRRLERSRDKVLHLLRFDLVIAEVFGDRDHRLNRAAGKTGDQIRHDALLFARRLGRVGEKFAEPLVIGDRRLVHQAQNVVVDVFRRRLQASADVPGRQVFDEFRREVRQVGSDPGRDENAFDAFGFPRFFHQRADRRMIRVQVRANRRAKAGHADATFAKIAVFAAHSAHVRRRRAQVGDDEIASGRFGERANFLQNRRFASVLDKFSLVRRDRAERAAAETAAMALNRRANDVERRDRLRVRRVRFAGVRQVVNGVHLLRRERERRRVDDDRFFAVFLNERLGAVGVQVFVSELRHFDEAQFALVVVLFDFVETREVRDRRRLFRQVFVASETVDRAADVADRADRFARGEAAQNFKKRTFAHPVNKEIAFRVERDRAANFIAPIIVMREATQRRFDAAGQDRNARERLTGALAVRERRPVGTLADLAARSVSVVVADLAVRRVMVDHRIHIPGADAKSDARASETAKIGDVVPVRLAQNGDAEPVRFKDASEKPDGETRVVDVSVAGNEDDVDFVPTAFLDFFGGHGKRRRRLDVGAVGARGGVEQEGNGDCAHCNRYYRFKFLIVSKSLPKNAGARRVGAKRLERTRRDEEERGRAQGASSAKFFLFSHIVAVYQAPPTNFSRFSARFFIAKRKKRARSRRSASKIGEIVKTGIERLRTTRKRRGSGGGRDARRRRPRQESINLRRRRSTTRRAARKTNAATLKEETPTTWLATGRRWAGASRKTLRENNFRSLRRHRAKL